MPDAPRYDQRRQTVQGDQGNVAGDVHVGPPPPDPAVLTRQGIDQLQAHAYQPAAAALRWALEVDPASRDARYYLALALLRGRRPKAILGPELLEIDGLLGAAAAVDAGDALFQWFRALVRDDYYRGNGMSCPPPAVDDIVDAALAGRLDRDELRSLLRDVPMPGNGLYSELARALAQ